MPEILPSIIYLNRDRNRAAGQEAVEQFLVTGSQKTPCGRCNLVHVDRQEAGKRLPGSSGPAAAATTPGSSPA